jgi:hypothetical protein
MEHYLGLTSDEYKKAKIITDALLNPDPKMWNYICVHILGKIEVSDEDDVSYPPRYNYTNNPPISMRRTFALLSEKQKCTIK